MGRGGAPSAFINGPAETERGGVCQTVGISQRRLESPGLPAALPANWGLPRSPEPPGEACDGPERGREPHTGPPGPPRPRGPTRRGRGQQKPRWVFHWPRKTEDGRGLTPLAHPAAPGGSVPLAPFRARLLSRPPKAQLGSPASTEQRQPRTRRTPQPRVRLRSRFGAAPPPPVGCSSSALCRPHAGLGSVYKETLLAKTVWMPFA